MLLFILNRVRRKQHFRRWKLDMILFRLRSLSDCSITDSQIECWMKFVNGVHCLTVLYHFSHPLPTCHQLENASEITRDIYWIFLLPTQGCCVRPSCFLKQSSSFAWESWAVLNSVVHIVETHQFQRMVTPLIILRTSSTWVILSALTIQRKRR